MTRGVLLSVCGEVERPARLDPAELRALMDAEVVADFHCREGWSRLDEQWRGVWDCFLSVKSVDRIEVTREPQRATAATIALARLDR